MWKVENYSRKKMGPFNLRAQFLLDPFSLVLVSIHAPTGGRRSAGETTRKSKFKTHIKLTEASMGPGGRPRKDSAPSSTCAFARCFNGTGGETPERHIGTVGDDCLI